MVTECTESKCPLTPPVKKDVKLITTSLCGGCDQVVEYLKKLGKDKDVRVMNWRDNKETLELVDKHNLIGSPLFLIDNTKICELTPIDITNLHPKLKCLDGSTEEL